MPVCGTSASIIFLSCAISRSLTAKARPSILSTTLSSLGKRAGVLRSLVVLELLVVRRSMLRLSELGPRLLRPLLSVARVRVLRVGGREILEAGDAVVCLGSRCLIPLLLGRGREVVSLVGVGVIWFERVVCGEYA